MGGFFIVWKKQMLGPDTGAEKPRAGPQLAFTAGTRKAYWSPAPGLKNRTISLYTLIFINFFLIF